MRLIVRNCQPQSKRFVLISISFTPNRYLFKTQMKFVKSYVEFLSTILSPHFEIVFTIYYYIWEDIAK